MTNLEKMNELVKASATKEQIKNWAYANRITVCNLHLDCEEFECMEKSVDTFLDTYDYFGMDEHEAWDKFLDVDYIG